MIKFSIWPSDQHSCQCWLEFSYKALGALWSQANTSSTCWIAMRAYPFSSRRFLSISGQFPCQIPDQRCRRQWHLLPHQFHIRLTLSYYRHIYYITLYNLRYKISQKKTFYDKSNFKTKRIKSISVLHVQISFAMVRFVCYENIELIDSLAARFNNKIKIV